MVAKLYLYFVQVFFPAWWPCITAGVYLGFDEIARAWFPRVTAHLDRVPGWLRRTVATLVLLATVFYAGFTAWDEEHSNLEQVTQQRDEARGQVKALNGRPETPDRHLTKDQKYLLSDCLKANSAALGKTGLSI
jgi:hypothetical protein